MDEIKYSIIIPHKNSIHLLKRCIESIPERNDLEIIVVDDNSGIAHQDFPYQERKNLKYIFLNEIQSNYAGHARNEGLKIAKGDWLLFADADDYYYTENLNKLLNKYKDVDYYDIVYFYVNVINEHGVISEYKINTHIRKYLASKCYSEKILRFGSWTPWTRMVSKRLVAKYNIEFEESPTGNDLYFGIKTSGHASKIACETELIYCYSRPTTWVSLTDSYYTLNTLEQRMEQTVRMNELYDLFNYKFKFSLLINYKVPSYIKAPTQIKEFKSIRRNFYIKRGINPITELLKAVIYKYGRVFKHI